MRAVKQITTFDDPVSVKAYERASATRASFLAASTTRMLDLAALAQGHRVLVIGAGTGEEALQAAARVGKDGEVIATDISAAMIDEARRAITAAAATNIRCRVMDAQHLSFGASRFDAVISRNALMFVPDVKGALVEAMRVLKCGGRVAVTVWASARRNPRLSDPLEAARSLGVKTSPMATFRIALRLGAPSTLIAALREAGFDEVAVERWPATARFVNVDAAIQQTLDHGGTRELMQLISGDSAGRMGRSLRRRWQKYTSADGVHLPGEQLVVAGTKLA